MKLDLLAIAAHPDDVELACSGTLLSHIAKGHKAGILDLTKGELGTRGTADIRAKEAKKASEILGISIRENLGFPDGFFENTESNLIEIIRVIRKYQPEIVLINAPEDRHPDHGKASELALRAAFLSGLVKIETQETAGENQLPWRPKNIFRYIQDRLLVPDLIIDITPYWEKKIESIKAYQSQFFDPNNKEPETYISSKPFWDFLEARAREYGHMIGVKYGEGFISEKKVGINNLFDII